MAEFVHKKASPLLPPRGAAKPGVYCFKKSKKVLKNYTQDTTLVAGGGDDVNIETIDQSTLENDGKAKTGPLSADSDEAEVILGGLVNEAGKD